MKKKHKVKRGALRRKAPKTKRRVAVRRVKKPAKKLKKKAPKQVVVVTPGNLHIIRSMNDKDIIFEAYKASKKDGSSPIYDRRSDNGREGPILTCKIGAELRVPRKFVCTSDDVDCGPGVNVATPNWVIKYHGQSFKSRRRNSLWVVQFTQKDIASIPGDDKFRLFKAKVVRKVGWADVARKHGIDPSMHW